MRLLVGIASAAALVATVAAPGASQAANFSDKLVVYNANGGVVKRVSAVEAGETISFHVVGGVLFDPSQFGAYTALLDPNGSVSDIVGITQTTAGGFAFGYKSDTETASPKFGGWGVGGQTVAEGGWVDVSKYLDTSPTSGQQGWTAKFWSAPDVTAVPEPASWILMICGLAAIGAGLRIAGKTGLAEAL
jgi:hypothetical protein